MIYGMFYNMYMSGDRTPKDDKVKFLKNAPTGSVLDLLRNTEDEPQHYEPEIVDAIKKELYDRKIYCY